MAKGITSGGNKRLNYTANLDIAEAVKKAKMLTDALAKAKVEAKQMGVGPVDTKPLTTYQAEQLKIKQQAIDIAKQKAEQAKAEKSASQVLQDALKQERLAREAINTQIAANRLAQQQANQVAKEQSDIQKQIANTKRPTQVSNSAAEIGKYNAGTLGTNGQVNPAFTSYLREVKKDFDSGKISAQQYVAELERYSAATTASNSATRNQISTTQAATKSKQELAQIEALNTLRVNENNAARKVAAKEAINEKGSSEQRKAALERLLGVYARLNAEERNTSYGSRMANTIAQLRVQIKGIEDQTKKMASTSTTSIDQYKASLQRLLAAYTALNKEQRDTVAGAKLAEMIKNLRDQIKSLDDETKSSKKGIAGIFEYLKNNVTSALGAIALLTAAWSAAKAVFSHNVEISDNFTDVQRTAKLSKEEVSEFGKELKKLDTRSSLEGLLDIGFIGGRLSVPKQELEDFVKQVDELAVVLKKEFPGGAEAVAESLGKIVTIYKVTQNEGVSLGTALSKVGSTLLELAHSGPVTVKYLQDFDLGVAGTAASAKLSIPVISAYGAVLGESGQIASSSALSITRLVTGLTTKTGKYFAIAQLADSTLTIEKFTKIVNTDTKQALDLFFKGLKAGNPAATEFAQRLGSVGITTGKVTNAVKILAENQDKLANRIGIATKAFDEGTSVAHNFELANNNLAASVDKLKNAAVNLTTDPNSNMAAFFKGIVDGSTFAIKAISDLDDALTKTQLEKDRKLVNRADGKQSGKEIFSDLFFGSGSQNKKEVDEARARIRENNSRLLNEEISSRGKASADLLANGKKEVEIRKLITGEIVKQKIANDRLANSLAFVANPKNSGESVEVVSKRINKLREAARQQSALVARLKSKLPGNTEVYGDGSLINQDDDTKTPETLKAEIKSLTAANKKLAIGSKELADGVAKLKQLKKDLKLALGGTDTESVRAANQAETAAKKQKTLQEKLNEAGKKGKREELEGDRKELAEKTAYYENLRKLAKEHNDAVDKFNNDPKNKGKAKRLRVDAGVLLPGESSTINVLNDKIKADDLKKSLDKQQKIYEEFESSKLKIGTENAKKLTDDKIDTEKTYLQFLKDEKSKLLNPDEKAKGGDAGGGEKIDEQLKVVQEKIDAQEEVIRKSRNEDFINAYEAAKGLTEKLLDIEADYQRDVKALNGKGTKDQLANLDRIRAKATSKAVSDDLTNSDAFVKLFSNLDELTANELDTLIKEIETKFNTLAVKFDPIDLAAIRKKLMEAKELVIKDNPFKQVSEAIKAVTTDSVDGVKKSGTQIAADWKKLGKSTEAAFDFVNNAVQSADFLKDAIGEVGATAITSLLTIATVSIAVSTAIKTAEKASVILAIISAALVVIQAIANIFKSIFAKHDKDIEKSIKGHKDQVEELTRAYNNLERAATNAVGEAVYKANLEQIENLKKQQAALTTIRNEEMSKKKADQGKIDEYNGQIQDSANKIEDINKQISQSLIQTNFRDLSQELADSLTDAFKAGADASESFDKVFNKTIANAIKNSLKLKLLEPVISDFTTALGDYAKNNNNSVLGFDFTTWKSKLEAASKTYSAGLKGAGEFFKDDNASNDNSSVGVIQKNVTEATASEWIGLVRAQYDNQKRQLDILTPVGKTIGDMYVIAKSNFDVQLRIDANTFRTANNTEPLADIKKGIDALVKNSTNGSNGYDRGK